MYSLKGAELIMFGYNTGSHMSHLWGSKKMSPEQSKKKRSSTPAWYSRGTAT